MHSKIYYNCSSLRSRMPLVSQEYIEIADDIRSGKPRIAGTRIAVEDMAVMHLKQGYSLAEIAGKHDLSLASVYAAMAYYFEHRDEIDRRTAEEADQVERLKQNYPSLLQEKFSRSQAPAWECLVEAPASPQSTQTIDLQKPRHIQITTTTRISPVGRFINIAPSNRIIMHVF
jgi:uncharacterized protein (DUF433 family)